MVIAGSGDSVPDCDTDPLTTGADVVPKLFAYSTTIAPGWAGVVEPGYRVAGPSKLPLACVAATYGPPLNTKNDGENACACAVKLAVFAPLLVTTTCTEPLIASGGVRMFTCVGLM